ncbi:unnamed protein product [Camellia sinensis]
MASTRPSLHSSDSNPNPTQPSLLVFSGGTAFNGVVEELRKLTTRVAHVLPVSDDGGSTAEIVRVLGGPAVGDIRSRCLRLSDQSTFEALAVRRLLGRRLPLDTQEAKSECSMILWKDSILFGTVSQNPIGKLLELFWFIFRIRSSVGPMNHFVSVMGGARIFFESLDAAIFLFSRVSDIPTESLVLPVISTNDRLTLGCELWDGTIIRGQNEISHPTNGSMEPINKMVSSSTPALPSRIKRVFYMSSEGNNLLHEVFPNVNPTVLDQLRTIDCIIYAMGSLFTSICPSLVLLGIGEIIASRSCPKVLLLNGTHDRETSGFSAACFVTAIADALNRTYGDPHNCLKNHPSQYINTLLVPKDGQIPIVAESLAAQGIFRVITVDSVRDPKVGVVFEPKSLIQALGDLLSGYTSTNAIWLSRTLPEVSMAERHEQWMARYGCVYEDDVEKEMRLKIFQDNVEFIESFDSVAGARPYKLSVNQFADLTNEEFQASHNGYKRSSLPKASKTSSFTYKTLTAIPSSMD